MISYPLSEKAERGFVMVPLGVEITPQFYWGKIKSFSKRKTFMI